MIRNSALYDEVEILKERIKFLENENHDLHEEKYELRDNIIVLQDWFKYEICDFFMQSNSIRITTKQFFFEDIRDCFDALIHYQKGDDLVKLAYDYEDCCNEMFEKDDLILEEI